MIKIRPTKETDLQDLPQIYHAAFQDEGAAIAELTENLLMEAGDHITNRLLDFRDAGIQLSIDDYGTGYSSLSYLSQLPLSILKVDMSFIAGIGKNAHDESIIDAILSMAQSLKLTTVAEGTETLAQIEYLRKRRCDYVQGFYFAKAKRYEELEEYLQETNKPAPNLTEKSASAKSG